MTNALQTAPRANRLADEPSPYLRQHQHNPVNWQPWGEEAFTQARTENKPIFLSIGYATCHWCHVMERESFTDVKVARFLNQHFVSIKVDREERPDVDRIYLTAVQALQGQGGWPLNVFLTPELKPFYGGTYFPPDNHPGRPNFMEVLQRIQQIWQARRSDILKSATQLHEQLSQLIQTPVQSEAGLNESVLHEAARAFKQEYDPDHGGFGLAPKFPRPSQPLFLLRYGARFKDQEAIRMVLHTCDCMAAGGIRDHLGGGFARYAVDAQWRVPHFEKMLYDNAQLTRLYLDAFQVSRCTSHAQVARDILTYVQRDMTHPEGGFYSAEDADSEGKEGKFYCWTRAELAALLTPGEFQAAIAHFGITEEGNFVDHSDPNPLPHLNVLSIAKPATTESERVLVESAKAKMREARSRRIRPLCDDKILTSWNGLMLGAFAHAYAVLGNDDFRRTAEANLAFLKSRLWDPATATLHHRWREGRCDSGQLLDDYAFLLSGVLNLYEATLAPEHLEFAIELAATMIARFYDLENGGFWQTPAHTAHLILRLKEDYDGAEPAGNSVAVMALLKLATMTQRDDFKAAAENSLRHFSDRLAHFPQAVPFLLMALDYWIADRKHIVITGKPETPLARLLINAAHSAFQPYKVVMGNQGPVDPFAKSLTSINGKATAYPCTGRECQTPIQNPAQLQKWLQA